MYGFKDKRVFSNVRVGTYLITLLFSLILVALSSTQHIKLNTENVITIAVGLIGWVVAVDILFLQIKLSLRRQLEVKAIEDIDKAIKEFSNAASVAVTLSSDFIVKPSRLPVNFWREKILDKHHEIAEHTLAIREGYGKIYTALETHEIAIIHLEHYYRYITIKVDDFIKEIDDTNTELLSSANKSPLTEVDYKRAVKKFSKIQQTWADVAMYFFDFRKILQNELLGNVFNRQLKHRRPKEGYGTTLDKVATPELVNKMVEQRDKELLGDV